VSRPACHSKPLPLPDVTRSPEHPVPCRCRSTGHVTHRDHGRRPLRCGGDGQDSRVTQAGRVTTLSRESDRRRALRCGIASESVSRPSHQAGNVSHTEAGATVIAVSDVSGGIYNDKDWMFRASWVTSRRGSRLQSGRAANALLMKSSGRFPANGSCRPPLRRDHQRDQCDHCRLQSRGGGANEPTTPTADRILEERGIAVIPDFLANAVRHGELLRVGAKPSSTAGRTSK